MGAEFRSTNFDGTLDRKELRIAYQKRVEQDKYERGHGAYSGTFPFGLNIKAGIFDDIEEAWAYLEDNAVKWDYAMAVYFDDSKKPIWLVGAWCAT